MPLIFIYRSTKKVKNDLTRLYRRKAAKIRVHLSDKLYVSFGENCLADDILSRNKLKLITTPFSHIGSNIEFILQAEKDNYLDFLNLKYLKYEKRGELTRPVLKKYNLIENDYHPFLKSGFSFAHHDVIKEEKVRVAIQRRISRMQKFKGNKRFIIFYHHRMNSSTNKNLLTTHLLELKNLHSTEIIHSEVICFTQNIITEPEMRKVSYSNENGVHYFVFNTLQRWDGGVDDIFWARCDDDLIKEMIDFSKKL